MAVSGMRQRRTAPRGGRRARATQYHQTSVDSTHDRPVVASARGVPALCRPHVRGAAGGAHGGRGGDAEGRSLAPRHDPAARRRLDCRRRADRGAAAAGASWSAWALVGGAAALALVGLLDDFRPLRPQVKFLVQVVVTAIVVAGGVRLTVTGVAADRSAAHARLAGRRHQRLQPARQHGRPGGRHRPHRRRRSAATSSCSTATPKARGWPPRCCGALAGFLVFNFQPASIFMGDTGSLFIGMLVGGLNVIGPLPLQPRHGGGAAAAGAGAAGADLRHRSSSPSRARSPGDRSRRAAATTPRTGWSRSGMSERGAVLALWSMAFGSGMVAVLSYRYGLPYTATLVGLLRGRPRGARREARAAARLPTHPRCTA